MSSAKSFLSLCNCKVSKVTNFEVLSRQATRSFTFSQYPKFACGLSIQIQSKIHSLPTAAYQGIKRLNNVTGDRSTSFGVNIKGYKLQQIQSARYFASTSQQEKEDRKQASQQEPEDHKQLTHFNSHEAVSETPTLPHPIWTEEQLHSVTISHEPPKGFVEHLAYYSVKLLRTGFDVVSGYHFGKPTEKKWLRRVIFLETVAGVPGMMGAMVRHLQSLRRMQRDYGWIHTLLEEAENERMHLLTFLQIREPSLPFRLTVLGAQGIFVNFFFLAYLISPKFCHKFVAYLEEQAVLTYTKCLEDIDKGDLWAGRAAPEMAITYWRLRPDADMRDVILAIRADEAHHRQVNHEFAAMKKDESNPYKPGE